MKRSLLFLSSCCLLWSVIACTDNNESTKNTPQEEESDKTGVIYDFPGYAVLFHVVDADGNNLMDAENENNLLDKEFYVLYNDEKYTLLPDEPSTRLYMPLPFGLRIQDLVYDFGATKLRCLSFGEFSPVFDYKDEKIEFYWQDGSADTFYLTTYVTYDESKEPTVHNKLLHNGTELDYEQTGWVVTKVF